MKMRTWLIPFCMLMTTLLVLGGCGSGGSGEPQDCEEGATLACTCVDGSAGAQACAAGVWGTCECQSAGCQEGQTQDCMCNESSPGSQTCSGGAWGNCDCSGSVCQNGQSQGCLCNDGSPGMQSCVNGNWGNCECSTPDCQNGQVQNCSCADGSYGSQTCLNGNWGTCECGTPDCQNGQTQNCSCADGSYGSQTCLNGNWGTCECGTPDCQNGQTQDCACADGAPGSQTCLNGNWGTCECASRCSNGQTQGCTCADGAAGEQVCQSGVWGACQCGSGGLANLVGTFASKSHMSTLSEAPLVGEVNSTTIAYALVQVTQNGNEVTTNAIVCGIDMDSGSTFITMTIPQAFINSLDPVVGHGQLQEAGGSVGIVTDEAADVRGWHPNDPWTDELPTEPDDPRVYDQDNDGNPGLTVLIDGLVDCESYVVMRDISSSEGTVLSDDRVESLVTFTSDMYLVGSTSNVCLMQNGQPTWQDPVAENSYSILQRIDLSWTCTEVLANKDTLF